MPKLLKVAEKPVQVMRKSYQIEVSDEDLAHILASLDEVREQGDSDDFESDGGACLPSVLEHVRLNYKRVGSLYKDLYDLVLEK